MVPRWCLGGVGVSRSVKACTTCVEGEIFEGINGEMTLERNPPKGFKEASGRLQFAVDKR